MSTPPLVMRVKIRPGKIEKYSLIAFNRENKNISDKSGNEINWYLKNQYEIIKSTKLITNSENPKYTKMSNRFESALRPYHSTTQKTFCCKDDTSKKFLCC